MTKRLAYDEWQELLEQEFFTGRRAGRSFFFDLTEARLRELSESKGDPDGETSLVWAARTYLGSEHAEGIYSSRTLFKRVYTWRRHFRAAAWPRGGNAPGPDPGPPPVLPILLTSVVAAHKMRRSESAAAHNYYVRFRELTGLPSDFGMPNGFELVARWWQWLAEWVDYRSQDPSTDVGTLLIPEEPYPPYVGYPISQARWRESDTSRVLERLRTLVNGPPGELRDEELIVAARQAGSVAHLGEKAQAFLMDPAQKGVVCRLLREFENEGPRKQAVALRLYLQTAPAHIAFIATRPEGWPSAVELADEDGRALRLEAGEAHQSLYFARDLQPDHDLLVHGALFESAVQQASFEPRQLYTFKRYEGGGYVEASGHGDAEDVALLFAPDLGQEPLGEQERLEGGTIPSGWVVLLGIDTKRLPGADPHAEASGQTSEIALVGGLRPGPARRVFLRVGLPEVETQGSLTIRVSGSGILAELQPLRNGRIALPRLPPASYELCADGRSIGIRVVDGFAGIVPPGRPIAREMGGKVVSGAHLSPSPPRPKELALDAHADERVVVGNRVGEVCRPEPREPPQWVRRAGLHVREFPYEPPFATAFTLHRFHSIATRAEVVDAVGPDVGGAVGDGDAKAWAEAVLEALGNLSGHLDEATAERYRAAAASVLDGAI